MLVKFERIAFPKIVQTSTNDLWGKWTNNIGLLENDSTSGGKCIQIIWIYEILAVQQDISRKSGIPVRNSSIATRCMLLDRHHVPSTHHTCLQLELGGSCFPEFVAYTQDVNQRAEQIKIHWRSCIVHCDVDSGSSAHGVKSVHSITYLTTRFQCVCMAGRTVEASCCTSTCTRNTQRFSDIPIHDPR